MTTKIGSQHTCLALDSGANTAKIRVNGVDYLNIDGSAITIGELQLGATDALSSGVSGNPVGTMLAYIGQTAPSGHLMCDGSQFDQLQYPMLYNLIGSNVLPDMRDQFLRGKSDSRALLSSQQDAVGTHAHSVTGQTVSGSIQGTTNRTGSHTHGVRYDNGNGSSGYAHESGNGPDGTYDTQSAGNHTHTVSGTCTVDIPIHNTEAFGEVETRVKNIAVNYIIKAC